MRRWGAAPWATVLVVTAAARAHADPPPAPSVRDTCADQAEDGQRVRDQGRLVAARSLFVACAQSSCPKIVAESCRAWLAEVEERLPSLVLAARSESGEDLSEVRVELDGAPLVSKLTGARVPVDPGPHVLVFHHGGRVAEQRLVVRDGERGRAVLVSFARAPASASVVKRPSGWPVVALGIGSVVSFAASGAFGLKGLVDYNRLSGSCSPSCSQDDVDSIRRSFLVSDVALGVGLVTLAAAAVLYLWGVRP